MGAGGGKQVIGYKFNATVHCGICSGPVDKITQIRFDNKLAWSGDTSGQPIEVDKPELFGGENAEGGVSGFIEVFMGGPTQNPPPALANTRGSGVPGYRGVLSILFNDFYFGNNRYFKKFSVTAERITTLEDGGAQWYPEKAVIGTDGDMNPIHILREVLTNKTWGRGLPETELSDASFIAAADKLHSEGLGAAIKWDRASSINDFIKIIEQHIDGSIAPSLVDGLITVELARDDYDINSLDVLDGNQISELSSVKWTADDELVNTITVKYRNRENRSDDAFTVNDTALVGIQGRTNGNTLQFPAVTNPSTAELVATRSLRALSTPILTCNIKCTRSAHDYHLNKVFVLNYPEKNINNFVMRVNNISFGPLGSSSIVISAAQDVFSLAPAVYSAPPPSAWTDDRQPPSESPHIYMAEASYWDLARKNGDSFAQNLSEASTFYVLTGVRPSPDTLNCILYSTFAAGGGYAESGTTGICPTATTVNAHNKVDENIAIENGVDLTNVSSGTYAVIGHDPSQAGYEHGEVVRVNTVTSTSINVARGCVDTPPIDHPAGTRILFVEDFLGSDEFSYSSAPGRFKLLPRSTTGTFDEASALERIAQIEFRHHNPYPPGAMFLNAQYYPDDIPGNVDLDVTWFHRDRLQQTFELTGHDEAVHIGPEPGITYNLELKFGGANVASAFDVNGTSHTFTQADMGSNFGEFEIVLWSMRNGLAGDISWRKVRHTFTRLV